MNRYNVIGVMSGTSLDGLDLALVEFILPNDVGTFSNKLDYTILKAETIKYNDAWKNELSNAHNNSANSYFQLHHKYGKYIGDAINSFIKDFKTPHLIASHGHTVFHQPQLGYSTQIGCGATISATTGITTICDFRNTDVALGGQGAPLVPMGDLFLFSHYKACLNIGGIANISFRKENTTVAFDICVANMLLNYLSQSIGLEYDKDGELAAQGEINQELLQQLNNSQYYSTQNTSKSLGREWFEQEVLVLINNSHLTINDKLATCTEHIALQIGNILNHENLSNVLITGGGAHNKQLVQLLKKHYKGEIVIPNKLTIDFKEALIFAYLGVLRMYNQLNTLKSVTGAAQNSSSGAIYLGNKMI